MDVSSDVWGVGPTVEHFDGDSLPTGRQVLQVLEYYSRRFFDQWQLPTKMARDQALLVVADLLTKVWGRYKTKVMQKPVITRHLSQLHREWNALHKNRTQQTLDAEKARKNFRHLLEKIFDITPNNTYFKDRFSKQRALLACKRRKGAGKRPVNISPITNMSKPTMFRVTNLSAKIGNNNLKAAFKRYGQLIGVQIKKKEGKALVVLATMTAEEANACVKGLHGTQLIDCVINVELGKDTVTHSQNGLKEEEDDMSSTDECHVQNEDTLGGFDNANGQESCNYQNQDNCEKRNRKAPNILDNRNNGGDRSQQFKGPIKRNHEGMEIRGIHHPSTSNDPVNRERSSGLDRFDRRIEKLHYIRDNVQDVERQYLEEEEQLRREREQLAIARARIAQEKAELQMIDHQPQHQDREKLMEERNMLLHQQRKIEDVKQKLKIVAPDKLQTKQGPSTFTRQNPLISEHSSTSRKTISTYNPVVSSRREDLRLVDDIGNRRSPDRSISASLERFYQRNRSRQNTEIKTHNAIAAEIYGIPQSEYQDPMNNRYPNPQDNRHHQNHMNESYTDRIGYRYPEQGNRNTPWNSTPSRYEHDPWLSRTEDNRFDDPYSNQRSTNIDTYGITFQCNQHRSKERDIDRGRDQDRYQAPNAKRLDYGRY